MATQTATASTINHFFAERARTSPDAVALRRKVQGKWEDVTWKGYRDAARKVGLGLRKLGLEKGHNVAILSNTRAEWAFCDMGILGVGGVTVPIYQSNLPDEVRYILEDSQARFLLLENLDQWRKIQPQLARLEGVERFVLIDTDDTQSTRAADFPWEGHERVLTFDGLLELGEAEDASQFDEAALGATPDDLVTLIYTSGTTGNPKGVMLTHRCAASECEALAEALVVGPSDVTLAFLPLAHVFARALHWTQLRVGYQVAFAQSLESLRADMPEIRPTFFAAVPRVFEKFHAGILAKVHASGSFARWAVETALEAERAEREGNGPGLGLRLKSALAGIAVKKVAAGLDQLTGGRIRLFISGGAPLSVGIAAFFRVLGKPIYEGYGLTETTAATHVNQPSAYKLGTVGKALRGVDCKIAADGEILVRGGMIMTGYFNRPDATSEVLTEDGWFHTGDIGVIDDEGYLKITDRKKDLIITAAGKNIAPQNVENHIKTHPYVSQVALFGDRMPFCVALITVDEEQVRTALKNEGQTPPATTVELIALPRVRELLQTALNEKNKDLPSYETVKYFELLPKDFEIGDELTPTLKVRRKVVKEKYGHLVEALYAKAGKKD